MIAFRTASSDHRRWEQATEWLLTFDAAQGVELPAERMNAFHRWISDEKNQHAFDRVELLMRDRRLCRQREVASRPERDADTYDPQKPLRKWLNSGGYTRAHRRWMKAGLVTAAAACAAVAVFVYPGLSLHAWRSDSTQLYQSQSDAETLVNLSDGSRISMGPHTIITASLTPQRRSIILTQGEALFEVAHDTSRPFVVIAGSGSITAVGTAFDVRRDADRVVVTVTEGTVTVAPQIESAEGSALPSSRARANTIPWAPARVTHGERLAYDENGSPTPIEHADPAAATAWRQGKLQFYGEPLRSVVQAVNRYSKRQIMVDSAAGELLYTGNVVPARIEAWILGLERILPVKTIEADDEHVLIEMSSRPPTL